MKNIETVLSSSIVAVFFVVFVVVGTMWYGSATTPIKLFGLTHYQWNQEYFQQEIYCFSQKFKWIKKYINSYIFNTSFK
ncbi:hypothetical protein AHAS_Ahas07G0135800 [Arachis hypogaea]